MSKVTSLEAYRNRNKINGDETVDELSVKLGRCLEEMEAEYKRLSVQRDYLYFNGKTVSDEYRELSLVISQLVSQYTDLHQFSSRLTRATA